MSDQGSVTQCPLVLPSWNPACTEYSSTQLLPFTLPMALQWQNSEIIHLKCVGCRTENLVFLLFCLILFLWCAFLCFLLQYKLISPEGMAEKLVWLQSETFHVERQLRDFLMRQVWVSIPTVSQCGHPLCDTAGKVQGSLMAELLRRKEEISVHSFSWAQENKTEIIWFTARSHDLLSSPLAEGG